MSILALIVIILAGYFLAMAIYHQVMTKYPNWTSRLWAVPMMLVYVLALRWGLANLNPAPTIMGGKKHGYY
jgi:hypothetical protein